MKNIYDLLNDTKVDTEAYEVTPMNDLEKASMKKEFHRAVKFSKKKSPYRWAAAAACMVCVIGFSQTAYAQTVIDGILQTISTGHNIFMQMDPSKEPAPSEQYYDKDGKPINKNTLLQTNSSNEPASSKQFYDKDGKPITEMDGTFDIYDASGKIVGTVTAKKAGDTSGSDKLIKEKDIKEAASHLSFKPLLPKTLPVNYAFDHAGLYPDANGKASDNCDYVDLHYTDSGKSIYVQERRITSDTAFATGTDGTIEKLKVNGHDAVLMDGNNINWEADGVSVTIIGKSLTRDELLAFAKSFA